MSCAMIWSGTDPCNFSVRTAFFPDVNGSGDNQASLFTIQSSRDHGQDVEEDGMENNADV